MQPEIVKPLENNYWHRITEFISDLAAYAFVLLFFYTAVSKIITYRSFTKILSELPLIGAFHEPVGIMVILIEIFVGSLLIFPSERIRGLWLSLALMVIFTAYLSYHVIVASKLPCSCGGVISGMTWPQHVAFNFGFILLAVAGLHFNRKLKNKNIHARKQVKS